MEKTETFDRLNEQANEEATTQRGNDTPIQADGARETLFIHKYGQRTIWKKGEEVLGNILSEDHVVEGHYVECKACGATAGRQDVLETQGICKTCGATTNKGQKQKSTEEQKKVNTKHKYRGTQLTQLQKEIKKYARRDKKHTS